MLEFWTNYGFYLWIMTTALVVIALAWLAWSTFAAQPEEEEDEVPAVVDPAEFTAVAERATTVSEAIPHMQATLGRTLQFCGLVRYSDVTGAQAFTLAVSNARGDGFVISSSVRGGVNAKPLARWNSNQPLTQEEQSAIQQARGQNHNA